MVDVLDPGGLQERVAFLRRPEVWPDEADRVETVETHLSWVFLTRRCAWKLKKPARYLTQDLRSLEAREASAQTEVVLNRRLAPAIYLGVAHVVRRANGQLAIDGPGEPVDALVRMVRLPADDLLDGALKRGTARPDRLRRVARLLADFYARATPRPMTPARYLARMRRMIEENRAALTGADLALPDGLVARVHDGQRRWLERAQHRLGGRGARVIDGHGDLRPEHVYLGADASGPDRDRGPSATGSSPLDGPAVIDCLEFDPDLRLLDPVDELGFLAVASERLGGAHVGAALFDAYRQRTADAFDPDILAFYQSLRSATRARLAAWRLREDGADVQRWIGTTASWMERATDRADRLRA